jgi:hypothetical protein
LFDLGRFYSRQVSILALCSPLILYSACALAAKQLSSVSGTTRAQTQPASLLGPTKSLFRHRPCKDYAWSATAYYDAAISLLLQHISDWAARDEPPVLHSIHDVELPAARRLESSSFNVDPEGLFRLKTTDEIVVAATILAIYEFLGGDGPTWSDHLDGTRSFLRLSSEAGFLDFHPSTPLSNVARGPSRLHRAAFWNFARQDMLSASGFSVF